MSDHDVALLQTDKSNNPVSLDQSDLRVQHGCDLLPLNRVLHACGAYDGVLLPSDFHPCVRVYNGV